MNFETMVDGLAGIAVVVALLLAVRYLGRFLSWVERSEIARQQAEAAERNKKSLPAPEPEGVAEEHLVVIAAAAVAACGYRLVHIADHSAGRAWASEGRWLHQTSHQVSHHAH